MREFFEFRIPEDRVGWLFGPEEGRTLGSGSVRKIVIEGTDPRLARIGELQSERRNGKPFFHGWDIIRKYTKAEIHAAELLHMQITAAFEPPGEMCGTEYDERVACMKCGAGRRQKSRLVLDLRKAPKSKAIARTIADEWVVRRDLADLVRAAGMEGCVLDQVRHKSRLADDPIDYLAVPTGRLLVDMAVRQGLKPSEYWDFEFCSWLGRPELRPMVRRADQEHIELLAKKERRSGTSPPEWFQLLLTAPPVRFSNKTVFGNGIFDLDEKKEHVCPFGHTKGLNMLSEVFVHRADYAGADITSTKECVGTKRGVLVPSPLLLISQRFFRLLQEHKVKGYFVEVAHFA